MPFKPVSHNCAASPHENKCEKKQKKSTARNFEVCFMICVTPPTPVAFYVASLTRGIRLNALRQIAIFIVIMVAWMLRAAQVNATICREQAIQAALRARLLVQWHVQHPRPSPGGLHNVREKFSPQVAIACCRRPSVCRNQFSYALALRSPYDVQTDMKKVLAPDRAQQLKTGEKVAAPSRPCLWPPWIRASACLRACGSDVGSAVRTAHL